MAGVGVRSANMPGEKLHQRARKKLSDGLNSWRKKRKNRAALVETPGDSATPDMPDFAVTPSVLTELACRGRFGSDEFLDGACPRDAEKSDSTTSPGSPSTPCLSPGDGSLDGDQFINRLFSHIISTGDTSDAETDGEGTLVGDDVASAHSLLSNDDVFWSPDEEGGEGGGAGGFRHYCGAVGDLLGEAVLRSVSDSECSSDSTLLNLTLSSEEETEPQRTLQIRVQGRHRAKKLSHVGRQSNLSHSDTAGTHSGSEGAHGADPMKAGIPPHGNDDVMQGQLARGDGDVTKGRLCHGRTDVMVAAGQLSEGGDAPNVRTLPVMRAMRTTSADVETLSEIHSMLDLTAADDSSPLSHAPLSLSMPELHTAARNDKVPDRRSRASPRSSWKRTKDAQSSPAFVSTHWPAHTAPSASAGGERPATGTGRGPDVKASPPVKISSALETFPADVKRRCWSRSGWRALHITGIPEELCLCNCDNVCEADVEVKHVEITADSLLSPDQVSQPIKLLAVYKVKVSFCT